MTKSDCCEERAQLYSISANIRRRANTDMCPYDDIRRGYWGLQLRFLFVAGILRMHGATGGSTVSALRWPADSACILGAWRFNWCVVSPRGNGQYLVVRQSQLGVTSMWFAQWAYSYNIVAAVVDTPCELEIDRSCLGTRPGFLASTCKAIDFWLCNPRVSGRGGSGPGKPSGMPQECTWITARGETCSEGGGSVPDI